MEAGATTTMTAKLSIFNPREYRLWLMRIEQYFLMTDYSLWEVIKYGKVLKKTVGTSEETYKPTSAVEKLDRRNEMKAKGTLLMALLNKNQLKFHSYQDVKLLMEAIEKSTSNTNEADTTAIGVSTAHTQGTTINSTSVDNLSDVVICAFLASQPNSPQLTKEDLEQIDHDDLEEMDIHWVMAMLTIRARRGYDWSYQVEEEIPTNYAFMELTFSRSSSSSESDVDSCSKSCMKAYANLKEQYDSLTSDYKKSQYNSLSYEAGLQSVEERLVHYKKYKAVLTDKINVLNLEVKLRDKVLAEYTKNLEKAEKDIDELKITLEKLQISSKALNNLLDSQVSDKSKAGLGYKEITLDNFVNSSEILEKQENISDKEYHAVPPPLTGNYMPSKHDLRLIDEHFKSVSVDVISNIAPSDVKTVKTIDVNHKMCSAQRNLNLLGRTPLGNPQQKEYKEKEVIDSGCSRHMTGNKCYLPDFKAYDGGFVSFGDGKGRISGKGKIKTGKLDFDDVYFCKELKYNLFSVSQMCDKKNNVLFTDTECLVLYSNFKLLDESQVLLRVPRKDNIYSVDLKSVVPTGGLTCLFAKATLNESNLWHMRLGHINFKTMNKLVNGNLEREHVGCVTEMGKGCVRMRCRGDRLGKMYSKIG
nr:ribonuclease H-like domain-containing protein [Tanacetum cinerariifolium]